MGDWWDKYQTPKSQTATNWWDKYQTPAATVQPKLRLVRQVRLSANGQNGAAAALRESLQKSAAERYRLIGGFRHG